MPSGECYRSALTWRRRFPSDCQRGKLRACFVGTLKLHFRHHSAAEIPDHRPAPALVIPSACDFASYKTGHVELAPSDEVPKGFLNVDALELIASQEFVGDLLDRSPEGHGTV